MNKIYRKLAFQNIKNNKSLYIPYIITSSVTIFMYYIFIAIKDSPDIVNSRGGEYIAIVLGLGKFIITLFSIIFLIYTNKFLVRSRDRELGLINMLGVDKKGITKIMMYENIFLSLVNIFIGIVASIIFSTLIFLLIGRYLSIELTTKFYVDFESIVKTVIIYLGIFLLVLIGNIIRIKKLKPLDLLKEAEKGEKEPKANIVLTVVGIICLVVGYYLANSTDNVLEALYIFFAAVMLVIIGTYILFTTISIFILKILKKNKKIYYKSKNMTFISSMIFRMKQNAMSLANICILSTMVLVMLVSTTSLVASKDYLFKTLFPSDIQIDLKGVDYQRDKDIKEIAYRNLEKENVEISNYNACTNLSFWVNEKGKNNFEIAENKYSRTFDFNLKLITIYKLEDYNKLTNEKVNLKNGEILIYSNKGNVLNNFEIEGIKFTVKENKKDINNHFKNMEMDLFDNYIIIANDLDNLYDEIKSKKEITNIDGIEIDIVGMSTINSFNVKGNENNINKGVFNIKNEIKEKYIGDNDTLEIKNKVEDSKEFISMHSGIFIVTILLSVLFLVATIMIIYYKQVSEGLEDAKNISILGKIGMSKKEIKVNISKQTRIVFFTPLLVAVIHLVGASNIIYNILKIIGIGSKDLFIKTGIITVLVYSIVYILIYRITLNSYYKISQKDVNDMY